MCPWSWGSVKANMAEVGLLPPFLTQGAAEKSDDQKEPGSERRQNALSKC